MTQGLDTILGNWSSRKSTQCDNIQAWSVRFISFNGPWAPLHSKADDPQDINQSQFNLMFLLDDIDDDKDNDDNANGNEGDVVRV